MKRVLRPVVAWLLAFLMPFQALATVYLDVRGPAHFHVAVEGERQGVGNGPVALAQQDRGHEYSHVILAMGLQARGDARRLSHSHGPRGVERHHHHPGDGSVVTLDDHGLTGDFALREETTSGWSGAMLAALPAAGHLQHMPADIGLPAPSPDPFVQNRTLGRLERPPRLIVA